MDICFHFSRANIKDKYLFWCRSVFHCGYFQSAMYESSSHSAAFSALDIVSSYWPFKLNCCNISFWSEFAFYRWLVILSFFSCACLSSIYLLWRNVFSTICLFCGRVVVLLLLSFKSPLCVLCLSYLLGKCKYFPLVYSLLLWKNHGQFFCRLTFSLDFSDDVMIKFGLCIWNKNATEVILYSSLCIVSGDISCW